MSCTYINWYVYTATPKTNCHTLPKTNIEPENDPIKKENHPNHQFLGFHVDFQVCNFLEGVLLQKKKHLSSSSPSYAHRKNRSAKLPQSIHTNSPSLVPPPESPEVRMDVPLGLLGSMVRINGLFHLLINVNYSKVLGCQVRING